MRAEPGEGLIAKAEFFPKPIRNLLGAAKTKAKQPKDSEHWIKRKFILTDETLRYFRPSLDSEDKRRDRALEAMGHKRAASLEFGSGKAFTRDIVAVIPSGEIGFALKFRDGQKWRLRVAAAGPRAAWIRQIYGAATLAAAKQGLSPATVEAPDIYLSGGQHSRTPIRPDFVRLTHTPCLCLTLAHARVPAYLRLLFLYFRRASQTVSIATAINSATDSACPQTDKRSHVYTNLTDSSSHAAGASEAEAGETPYHFAPSAPPHGEVAEAGGAVHAESKQDDSPIAPAALPLDLRRGAIRDSSTDKTAAAGTEGRGLEKSLDEQEAQMLQQALSMSLLSLAEDQRRFSHSSPKMAQSAPSPEASSRTISHETSAAVAATVAGVRRLIDNHIHAYHSDSQPDPDSPQTGRKHRIGERATGEKKEDVKTLPRAAGEGARGPCTVCGAPVLAWQERERHADGARYTHLACAQGAREQRDDGETPDEFVCPISMEVMVEPVLAADGFTYERQAIEQWFELGHRSSPRTGAVYAYTLSKACVI